MLDSNGLEDALWCLRAVTGYEREIRLYAVWCARQCQGQIQDPRSLAALDVAERFANGEATDAELAAAWEAACRAVGDAEYKLSRISGMGNEPSGGVVNVARRHGGRPAGRAAYAASSATLAAAQAAREATASDAATAAKGAAISSAISWNSARSAAFPGASAAAREAMTASIGTDKPTAELRRLCERIDGHKGV